MLLIFDPKTLEDFHIRSVGEVFVWFVSRGCEGTKIEVLEIFDSAGLESEQVWDLTVYFKAMDRVRLLGSRITHAGNKWIFSSEQVQGRCGCGSSFSFEKKLLDPQKLAKLKIHFAWKSSTVYGSAE